MRSKIARVTILVLGVCLPFIAVIKLSGKMETYTLVGMSACIAVSIVFFAIRDKSEPHYAEGRGLIVKCFRLVASSDKITNAILTIMTVGIGSYLGIMSALATP